MLGTNLWDFTEEPLTRLEPLLKRGLQLEQALGLSLANAVLRAEGVTHPALSVRQGQGENDSEIHPGCPKIRADDDHSRRYSSVPLTTRRPESPDDLKRFRSVVFIERGSVQPRTFGSGQYAKRIIPTGVFRTSDIEQMRMGILEHFGDYPGACMALRGRTQGRYRHPSSNSVRTNCADPCGSTC